MTENEEEDIKSVAASLLAAALDTVGSCLRVLPYLILILCVDGRRS